MLLCFNVGDTSQARKGGDKQGVRRMAPESDYGELETTDRYDVMQKPSGDMY